MKFNVKKLFGMFFILLLSVSAIHAFNTNTAMKYFNTHMSRPNNASFNKNTNKNKNTNTNTNNNKKFNPSELVEINDFTSNDKRVEIDLSETDPLEYMKRKEELIKLYLNNKSDTSDIPVTTNTGIGSIGSLGSLGNRSRLRFKQSDSESGVLLAKPTAISKFGDPTNKEYHNGEEVVRILKVEAQSYTDVKTHENFTADNILADDNKFWCSEGNHELNTPVKFYTEFEKSFRLSAFWIFWAFAPGQYKISYANKKASDGSVLWLTMNDWQDSVKGGDTNWWKSIIANPRTRWKYKSFDVRVTLDEPTWARYILIEMRLPVNQYYGIYKLEFYIKSKAVVMLKSRLPEEDSCMAVVNGKISNNSPVVMIGCLQGISYGDNRDLFVLNSNGFITTYKENKCLQSPSQSRVDVLDCGTSSDFKDDREKWILEYDGKIRSTKEEYTCLSVTDFSVKDEVPPADMKLTASSSQNDGTHAPEKAVGEDAGTYWASNPTISPVVFEIFFFKHPYILKDMTIEWKFPAKAFQVVGLYPDGYWRIFKKITSNRDTTTVVSFLNKDLMGIRITMTESSTKIEEKFVYGITNLFIHTGGRYLRRDPCKDILLDANKFEIIDVSILDGVTGLELEKAKAGLHRTRSKLRIIEEMYRKVPDTILTLKETSAKLTGKLRGMSEKFNDMQLKLTKFEVLLNSEEIKIFTIATSEHFPANDCAHIIKAFPSKRSGMYWIKNECMPHAQQVYCDFDSYENKGGLDYLVFNNNAPVNVPFKFKFKSHLDLKYKCYELGLDPIEIKNEQMLKNVYYLLKILNYDLNTDYIVPIGYDYNCDLSKCSKNFKSLNDQDSGDISDFINTLNDQNGNSINNLFSNLSTNDVNNLQVAGFGKVGNIVYQKLSTSKISGIVCSTNQDGRKTKTNFIDGDCNTNLRSERFFAHEVFSILRMNCPADCAKVKSAQVFGTDLYTDNSSVCRAAVHAGAKKDNEEAVIEVTFQSGRDKYLGVDRYNIASLDYADKWNRSFSVKKYNPYCPIDKLREYIVEDESDESAEGTSASFMEMNVEESLGNLLNKENNHDDNYDNYEEDNLNAKLSQKISERELVVKIQQVIQNYQFLVDQDRSISTDSKQKKLVEKLGQISRFLQSKDEEKDNIKENKSTSAVGPEMLEKMRLMNSIQNKNDFLKLGNNILQKTLQDTQDKFLAQSESEKMNNFLGFQLPKTSTTTEIALTFISAKFTHEKNGLSDIKKVSDDFKGIIGKTLLAVEKLNNDKDLGVLSQQTRFADYESKTAVILKYIYEIDRRIQNKLKQTEFKVKEARDKMNFFNIRESFIEDYNSPSLLDNWKEYTSLKGKGSAPQWDYFQYFIAGHYKVIKHLGGFMDNRSGAHLILKHKDYYDFEFKCSMLLKDNNTFGVAFRYVDPFNYYLFEVSNQEGGIKRMRKFVKGVSYDIDTKNDGGFIQSQWYNVKIRAQQSLFHVYMTDFNGAELESHYELQFKFLDNELVHGTVAFASMGMRYSLIDNISVVSIECTNFDETNNGKARALTPTCARFRESFRHGFNFRWKTVDPLENVDGPSSWQTVNDFAERDVVLVQKSLIAGTSEFQEGSIFLLNDLSKVCNYGRFIVKLKAMDEGVVGLVFRFNNEQENVDRLNNSNNGTVNNVNISNSSYYILEISGVEGDKFIRIRKKIKDKFTLVSSNPNLGYSKNNWFKIILTIENDTFNAFITENSSQDNITKVFSNSAVDNDIKFGLVGISTYKTKVIVDEIQLAPFDNFTQAEEELIYVDEEELELPKSKLKEKSVFDRVNTHIENFSWAKCLLYPVHEDRTNYCNVLFSSQVEIANCKGNFCDSCCNKMVDGTNKEHNFLCGKQCSTSALGARSDNWNSCVEPSQPETSIYPYCEEHFGKDLFKRQRCKTDMCNLCCISIDQRHSARSSDKAVNKCYGKCAKVFNVKPTKELLDK